MVICPNCSHPNPDGAIDCEACYTALPATQACPQCGASLQVDATFCGQCGYSLKSSAPSLAEMSGNNTGTASPGSVTTAPPPSSPELPATVLASTLNPPTTLPIASPPNPSEVPTPPLPGISVTTQLQRSAYHLLHLQTSSVLEIPPHLSVIHIGKPNDKIPPDLDVSGFPCSEVVSRVHANIRVDGDSYYIEDTGSANGTYINHNSLVKGNRHLLRVGDRISLGKGDLVTFIFHSS
jgi:FHA domain/Double zinc ribbon